MHHCIIKGYIYHHPRSFQTGMPNTAHKTIPTNPLIAPREKTSLRRMNPDP